MRPEVSVILPARDCASTVIVALRSVIAQTFTPWELIVVDDGSRDETVGEVIRVAARDSRIAIITQEHAGIVPALESGIGAARGNLIARMDADDEMMPDRLRAQVEFLKTHRDIGVVGSLVEFGGDPVEARGYALHVAWMNSLIEADAIARERFVDSPLAHPSVMFRRELLAQHGGYREGGWPEDYDLWLRWMDAGVRFAKVPRVLLRWNDPPSRLSRMHASYGERALYACKCHYLARWIRREVSPERRVFLWGAGRVTRKRFAPLAAEGVVIVGYVDIDPRKVGREVGSLPIISPDDLPNADQSFVIAGVGTRGAREQIRAALIARGFVEGRDFFAAA